MIGLEIMQEDVYKVVNNMSKDNFSYAIDEFIRTPMIDELMIIATMYAKFYIELGEIEFAIKADKILNSIGSESKGIKETLEGIDK